jgi:hypothetical protein
MMMKKFMLVLVLMSMLFTNPVFAVKIVPLPQLQKPNTIAVDDNQIYIADGTSIYIYSLKDFSLKKKFGRGGEGPQEFKRKIYIVDIQHDYLVVNSPGKVTYLTKDGKFIKEMKTPPQHIRFRPLGKKFTGVSTFVENKVMYQGINIYDENLKKEKEAARMVHEVQWGKGTSVFAGTKSADTCENKLLIAAERDFLIDVFDENGKKLDPIKKEYKKIKVTNKDKEDVIYFLKTDPETKYYFEMLKPIKISDYYPAIRQILGADKKVYAVTWKRENGNVEWFIFNIDGRFLKKVFIPLKSKNVIDLYTFAVKNETCYQLFDNPDTEEWELHITKIK